MLYKVIIPMAAFSYSSLGMSADRLMTASFSYSFDGESEKTLLEVVKDIEKGQGDNFMHVKGNNLKINFRYESQPDGDWLANAERFINKEFCIIRVNPEMKPGGLYRYSGKEHLAAVLRHEIGHCFGLNHSPYHDSVMFWEYDGFNYRDIGAIQAFNLDLGDARVK